MRHGLFEVILEISQVPTKHLAFVVVKNRNSLKLTEKKKKRKDLLYNCKWAGATRLLGTKAGFALCFSVRFSIA